MKTKTYTTSWKMQNKLLGNKKPTTKICCIQSTQLENSQWFETSPSWSRVNDTRLCQNGGIEYVTT
jgi:hypothetical protein